MINYLYTRNRADKQAKRAKSKLRYFYLWQYGSSPPEDWQADHQVEQQMRLYERFGPELIHSLTNMFLVPAEVNTMKNIAFNRTWERSPEAIRHILNPVDDELRSETNRPQRMREMALMRSYAMNDNDAWNFLWSFGREMLKVSIEEIAETQWRTEPPEWLRRHPQWKLHLFDDIQFHVMNLRRFEKWGRECSIR